CGRTRDWKAKDADAVVCVLTRTGVPRVGCGNDDGMAPGLELLGETGDIDFGSPDGLREVPPESLDDLHGRQARTSTAQHTARPGNGTVGAFTGELDGVLDDLDRLLPGSGCPGIDWLARSQV